MEENVWRSGKVDLAGRHVAYEAIGQAENPVVVLLHALASHSATWHAVGQRLSEHRFRVVAFDLPGHGGSSRSKDYSLNSLARDISAAMDCLDLGCVSLVGHSLGALVATRIAVTSGSRIQSLVLEAMPAPPRTPAEAYAMAAGHQRITLGRAIRLLGWRRLARIIFLREFDPKASKFVVAELGVPAPSWWASLCRIEAPTLVICSPTDGPISDRAAMVAWGMASAKVEMIGQGHHLHGEHLEAFLAALVPFLTGQELVG